MNNKPICKVDEYGTKYWHFNGKLHRENGSAIECSNGHKYWYLNGERHREDGPAVEHPDGHKSWYLNGKLYSKKDYYKELVKRGIMTYEEAVLEML